MRPLPQPPPRFQSVIAAVWPPFEVDATEDGAVFVIRVQGELDLSRCHDLERAFAESEASEARRVLLDLEELTFIDAAGLHALLAASRRSADNGDRLRLTRGRGEVAKMLRLTALDLTLPFL